MGRVSVPKVSSFSNFVAGMDTELLYVLTEFCTESLEVTQNFSVPQAGVVRTEGAVVVGSADLVPVPPKFIYL